MVNTRRSLRIQQRLASESETSDINTDDEGSNLSASASKPRRRKSTKLTTNEKVSSVEGIPPTVDECVESEETEINVDPTLETDKQASPTKKLSDTKPKKGRKITNKKEPEEMQDPETFKTEGFKSHISESPTKRGKRAQLEKKTPRKKRKPVVVDKKQEILVKSVETETDDADKAEDNNLDIVHNAGTKSIVYNEKKANQTIKDKIDDFANLDLDTDEDRNLTKNLETHLLNANLVHDEVQIKSDNSNGVCQISNSDSNEFLKLESDVDKEDESCNEMSSDQMVIDESAEESEPVSNYRMLKPKFKLDYKKYDVKPRNQLSGLALLGTDLQKNSLLQNQLKKLKNPRKNATDQTTVGDIFGLDGARVTDTNEKEPRIETKIHKAASIKSSLEEAAKQEVKNLMKRSVLPSDMEKEKNCPRFYINKYKVSKEKQKKKEETAGTGWYNLPKTEMTDEIKKDLQIIKMRSTLDTKHHYKRSDQKNFPKFFQMGTIVEGAHEFYSSRMTKKERKRTMVDELLADAEFRKKNKKRMIEYEMRKGSGGKGYYKKKVDKKKAVSAKK